MKAAVCYQFGEPLVIEEVSIESPHAGEVLVRLVATAICHSDIHYLEGERTVTPPFIVGHEATGIIEQVGPGVTGVQPGDRVVVSLLRSCGSCFFCMAGQPYHCSGDFALLHESRVRNSRGEWLGDAQLGVSAFAERVVVHASQVVPVGDDIPPEQAALLACGVITGVGAVINTAQLRPGSNAVVIGTGGVGLNAVQGAIIAGARTVIGCDVHDTKLAAAREFGATDVLNITQVDAAAEVRERTEGRGADYVFVTVGSAAAAAQGMSMVRTGGTLVIVGLPAPDVSLSFIMRDVGWAGQRILGSTMGSTRLQYDVPWLVDLYRQGRLKLAELVSGCFRLDDINDAIAEVKAGSVRRNVIIFDRG